MYVQKTHSTGMAGEFCVMERLFRLGHEASLTFGHAKSIDIMTKAPSGKKYEVSVKAIRGGTKWGIGKEDYSARKDLVFVLLLYKDFENVAEPPETWVIPARKAEQLKKKWHPGIYAIYRSPAERDKLEPYRDAWQKYLS